MAKNARSRSQESAVRSQREDRSKKNSAVKKTEREPEQRSRTEKTGKATVHEFPGKKGVSSQETGVRGRQASAGRSQESGRRGGGGEQPRLTREIKSRFAGNGKAAQQGWVEEGSRQPGVGGRQSAGSQEAGGRSQSSGRHGKVEETQRGRAQEQRRSAEEQRSSARQQSVGAQEQSVEAEGQRKSARDQRGQVEEMQRDASHEQRGAASQGRAKEQRGKLREPKPPFPAQHQPKPGLEVKLEPKPRYEGARYREAAKLKDKVALITGGDSGIGRAVAVLYAREGADVAIVYLPEEQVDAEETKRAVQEAGRECLLLPGDVTDAEFCEEAVERAVDEFGKLDILVNNAAFQQHQEKIEDVSNEQFEHTFRTNIFGYFYMAKAALRHMKDGAAIVNCGSITGLRGSKQLLDYASTKGAIHAFTKSLAQNVVERGIRVNCVAPGPVWTPLNVADKDAKQAGEHGKDVPMERPAQPEEIAPAFVFFASEADSSYITGEVLTLLGGETEAA